MKTRLISWLLTMLTLVVSSFSFMSCSNDVENIIVLPGDWNNGYVKKDGSNFIMNIGDSNYGTQSYSVPNNITRAIATDDVTPGRDTKLSDVIVGTNYSTNLWDEFMPGTTDFQGVAINSNEGYVYARAELTSPYENGWSSTHKINEGKLTIKGTKSDLFWKPVPVEFWGRHDLAVNDQEKTTWDESYVGQDGWTVGNVESTTKTVAISKNIQYANAAVKINLTLGTERYLAWYDKYEQATNADGTPLATKGTLITQDNINDMPTSNYKHEGDNLDVYVSNTQLREVGKYFHIAKGNTIAIKQSQNGYKYWHFIGDDPTDDINFEIQEIRIESSDSCVYEKDYAYTPSDSIVKYSYIYEENHVKSGESTTMTIMPTSQKVSKVILHCKITKFPTSNKNFVWYINKSLDNDKLVAVQDYTEFYIVGKITAKIDKPTGTPYASTWDGGIYCPDVLTSVNVHIDDLCVDGAAVTDPDGDNDSNIIWNYDWEYGQMEGVWSIGK